MKNQDRKHAIAEKLFDARAKIALTIHNDPMPSRRLTAAAALIGEALDELAHLAVEEVES